MTVGGTPTVAPVDFVVGLPPPKFLASALAAFFASLLASFLDSLAGVAAGGAVVVYKGKKQQQTECNP